MAGTSLFALLDDIATLLDDVAAMTKVATRKTAGVLGDDLALNAQQVSGVRAERELPVVWAVAMGSARNKLILVPAALAISFFLPALITPLLMIGGAYLCYEGFEKVAHALTESAEERARHRAEQLAAVGNPEVDLVAFEKDKIRGAIRTDFILSAEIIVIALGTVQNTSLSAQIGVLIAISVLMTVGVYGLVAGIVKLDDAGMYLAATEGTSPTARLRRDLGGALLVFAPYLMKTLSVVGTAAMFLVGGGILVHGIPGAEALAHQLDTAAKALPGLGFVASSLAGLAFNAAVGLAAGALVLAGVKLVGRLRPGAAA